MTAWVEDRIGLAPVPRDDVYSADGTARVAHRHLEGAAGTVSRWDTLQVRDGWGWRTTLWLTGAGDTVALRVRLQVEATGDRIIELRRPVMRPAVVAQVLGTQRVVVDGFRLGVPLHIDVDDVAGLARFLLDPTRTLPVVAITQPPDAPTDPSAAQRLADAAGGLAHVVDLSSEQATQQLAETLGNPALAVADGAIRLYWPGFRADGNPFAHPLLGRDRVRGRGLDIRPGTSSAGWRAAAS